MAAIKPDYRVILIDETHNWDESITAITGRIAGAYVVNFAEVTHLCSLRGSYWGEFLRNVPENWMRGPDGYSAGVPIWGDDDSEGTERGKALFDATGDDWHSLQYENGGESGCYLDEGLDPANGSPIDMEGAGWDDDTAEMTPDDAERYRKERDEAAYEAAREYECNGEEWEDIAPWNRKEAA